MSTAIQTFNVERLSRVSPIGLPFVIGFFFAFRISIVLISVDIAGTQPRTGSEITLLLNLILLVLVCFQSLGYVESTFRSIMRLSSIRWVFIFLGFSLCSFFWSGTVSPSASFAYWCGMTSDVVIVLLLLCAGPVAETSNSILKGFVAGACCIAMIAWIMPADIDLRLGDEEYFNANQIGNLCAFAIFIAQYLIRRKEGRWGVAAFFLATTLVRSLSKTTIAAFLLSQGFLLIRDKSMSRKTRLLIASVGVLLILAFWGLFEAYYDIYTTAGNQAETLTGRTAIWAYVMSAALEHPWIGHGFDAMWKVIPPFGPDSFEARHAENELLQQFYAYGLAGVCILVGLYSSLYRQIRRISESSAGPVFISLLLFVLVRGLAEAEPFDLLFPVWAIVVVSSLTAHTYSIRSKAAALASAALQTTITPAPSSSL